MVSRGKPVVWLLLAAPALGLSAQNDGVEVPSKHEDLLRDEVYAELEYWREQEATEQGWRKPRTSADGRVSMLYDRGREEFHLREETRADDGRYRLPDPQPTTIFRMDL